MKYKALLITAVLTALALPAAAQHKTVLYDSTSVVMEESGLSHVINHQRIRANDFAGCKELATVKVDYDPLSAYVEFRQVLLHHANGTVEDVLLRVYDYVAPARLIYWGASQKMVQIGHLDHGDEVEFVTYRKGFTYALLGENDDDKYIPPMRGHFYDIVPFWSESPVNKKVYQVDVLTEKHLRFELYNCPADQGCGVRIDSTVNGDRTVYTFTKDNITPLKREPRALANNDIQPKLLLSTSPNWQAKSIWFYGVNEDYGSFVPTPEVQAQVNALVRESIQNMMIDLPDEESYEAIEYIRETYGRRYAVTHGANPDILPQKLSTDIKLTSILKAYTDAKPEEARKLFADVSELKSQTRKAGIRDWVLANTSISFPCRARQMPISVARS